ncbi:hypothetical protein Cgig2_032690 [Carnegiea gigantea]|uniref:Uncharacterized protein n=1 Tax=Carnegiea gigantea TaxID=171969 RepID=A0A9Q1QJJ4_9CARY|nr:hypothetical protein Cgig2_032690 [Carnegiea gigantea]
MGLVVGGDDLDEDFNGRILPPKNPRGAGRPKKEGLNLKLKGGNLVGVLNVVTLATIRTLVATHVIVVMLFDNAVGAICECVWDGLLMVCLVWLPLQSPAMSPAVLGGRIVGVFCLPAAAGAKIVEHHDNYRRRYACCPKQDEYACGYFEEVDPEYPSRAMEVIDDLVADMRDVRDVLLEERNNQYWMEEEDRAVEDGMRAELDELKGVVGVAFAAIVVLVAALLVMWSL